MPIEIKELIIRATIDSAPEGKSRSTKGNGQQAGSNVVEACVEKVLEILEKQKQR